MLAGGREHTNARLPFSFEIMEIRTRFAIWPAEEELTAMDELGV
jgi:hypothetical protein